MGVFGFNSRAITVDIRGACSNVGKSCAVIQENSARSRNIDSGVLV